jgi:1-phosphofructokinase family hexose kinase
VILVVGQNADWHKVATLRRLEPGTVNRLDDVTSFGSSKGPNVVRALAGVGVEARVICYTGGANGRLFLEQLAREGIACDPVPIAAETRTCTTFVDSDGRCTEVIEPAPEVTAAERSAFRALVAERLAGSRVLALMGSTVRGETTDCYRWPLRAAHERGVPVVMDSACPAALEALAERPEVLKVNAEELAQFAGYSAAEAAAPGARAEAYRALRERGVRWVLVTLGADGVEAGDGTVVLHAAVPRVTVVNSIGSGDAAAAGVAWSLHEALADEASADAVFASRDRLADAVARAAAMGTANCLNPMNGCVDAADYRRLRAEVTVRRLRMPDCPVRQHATRG